MPRTAMLFGLSRAMHTINDGRCIDDGNIWPYIRITEQGAGRWIDLSCIDRPFMSCMEQFRFGFAGLIE